MILFFKHYPCVFSTILFEKKNSFWRQEKRVFEFVWSASNLQLLEKSNNF